MNKRTTIALLIISIYFYSFNLIAQQCPGITFTTQAQIDNFQVNYPGCTEIMGSVEINGNNISNLNGLNVLTSIGGHLEIGDVLTLYFANPFLGNVTGLENLTSIGGDLYIGWNANLTSITGLENLTSIGGDLSIFGNDNLSSITGLGNLNSIGGSLSIEFNTPLTSLTVLENVTSIGGGLNITGSAALTSLEGIGNIDAGSIGNLMIYNNQQLSSCEVQSICDYLVSPNGTVTIYGNDIGCNSAGEIASACGFTMPCLPTGNYHFTSQSDIDNFQLNFPGCTDLAGDVYISGNDITNLYGLNTVTSITGSLRISHSTLTSLNGLEDLNSIGGYLRISKNDSLTSLNGLENLTSIGYHLTIWNNDALNSLTFLQNLTSINGDINISDNYALESIYGLDNIESTSITNINIENNLSLSSCHVQSICNYLVSPIGTFNISNNASGCNSPEEVFEACETVSIADVTLTEPFTINPNPISSTSIIEYHLTQSSPVTIQIIDVSGQVIKQLLYEQQHQGEQKIVFDGTVFKSGVYFVVLKTNQGIQTNKLIKL